jgi:hypothetical protein
MRLAAFVFTLFCLQAYARPSVVRIRCPEDCKVKIDHKYGLRLTGREWEFTETEPGQRRVDVTGKLDRPLFSGYTIVPEGVELTLMADHSKRLIRSEEKPLSASPPADSIAAEVAQPSADGEATATQPASQGPSRLHVRCSRPCTVYVDGLRKSGAQQSVTIDLPPGSHEVQAKDQLNALLGRGKIHLPPGTEVYTVAGRQEIKITNTKPLAP